MSYKAITNQKDKAVGILVFHNHEKAHPATLENVETSIWKTEDKIVDVKISVERLWVAKKYRRQGKGPFITRAPQGWPCLLPGVRNKRNTLCA